MRALIDAHMLGTRETGNETYTRNLINALSQLPDVRCGAAVYQSNVVEVAADVIPLKPSTDWARLLFTLPRACKFWGADILHVNYVGPLFTPCPLVVSVHDVSFKRYPKFFSLRDRLLFSVLLPFTLRKASAVITISEHAKDEIETFFPNVQGKTRITYLAASPVFRKVDEPDTVDSVRLRYRIQSPYILAVGNLQPRKNLLRIIEAFADVRKQIKDIQLVVVGQDQWQSSKVYKRVNQLKLTDHVVFTGYIPTEDLVRIYNAATVFVYPSIYEGFGLPILEAMACGTPVVASNTSAIPELAEGAAVLVDPTEIKEITQALLQIFQNPELQSYLSEQGLQRAHEFSWTATAQTTTEVYKSVLSSEEPK